MLDTEFILLLQTSVLEKKSVQKYHFNLTASGMFSPASIGQPKKTTLSPAQLDPFYTQGDSLTSEDQLDDTWVTVFG